MIYGPRGLGKTQVALGIAWAVAAGGGFLNWQATSGARRVVLIDGEMPAVVLQERLAKIVRLSGLVPPLGDYLRIVASDCSAMACLIYRTQLRKPFMQA